MYSLGLMPTNELNSRSNCFLLRQAIEDNLVTGVAGAIYICFIDAVILLTLHIASDKVSVICDSNHSSI